MKSWTACIAFAALVVASGMGVATFQQAQLNWQVMMCQRVTESPCRVTVIPKEDR